MTHTKLTRPRRQGRIFPEFTIPPEELARREAEKKARCQKARSFFEQVTPLIGLSLVLVLGDRTQFLIKDRHRFL